jgi:hypothetical protein
VPENGLKTVLLRLEMVKQAGYGEVKVKIENGQITYCTITIGDQIKTK